jgi:hypothetical protein
MASVPYTYLWDSVLADLLVKAGFTDEGYFTAFRVIQGESAGDPYSTLWNKEGKPEEYDAGEPLPDRAVPVVDTLVGITGGQVVVKAGQTVPVDAFTLAPGVFISRPARPAQGWFPGGESHDIGLCQWNDYWLLSSPDSIFGDPTSEFYCPDAATALKNAYNPVWSARAMYAFTDGGVRNWNTWNAYSDGNASDPEFIVRAQRALDKVIAGTVQTMHTHMVGGARPIYASSIPARCNPPISWERWIRHNGVLTVKKRDAAGKIVTDANGNAVMVKVNVTPNTLIYPTTVIRVNYTTTRIAAGPIPNTVSVKDYEI